MRSGAGLQEFLVTARWDHDRARDTLQAHIRAALADLPADPLGSVGVVDETSCRKWGDHTPGVQRQYLGCVGKIDNGIVTVHLGVTRGTFQTLLDADLYLPKSWAEDRERCRAAGNPAVTEEQVCRALNQRCGAAFRRRRGVPEARHTGEVIRYHQRRNAQAAKSHKKQRHRPAI